MRISDWSSDVCSSDLVQDSGRDLEGRVRPAERLAGGGDLRLAQGRAVGGGGALLVGGAEADGGAAGDEARAVALLRGGDGAGDGIGVVAVDALGRPAGGAEAGELVVGAGKVDAAVDRDRVVVEDRKSTRLNSSH